jgi:hypothetical protein
MSAITAPLSTPRRDDTARDALRNVARTERPVGLWVSIEERCGKELAEAFVRAVGATFTGHAA